MRIQADPQPCFKYRPLHRYCDEGGVERYRPAYLLQDGALEREGRKKKQATKPNSP